VFEGDPALKGNLGVSARREGGRGRNSLGGRGGINKDAKWFFFGGESPGLGEGCFGKKLRKRGRDPLWEERVAFGGKVHTIALEPGGQGQRGGKKKFVGFGKTRI